MTVVSVRPPSDVREVRAGRSQALGSWVVANLLLLAVAILIAEPVAALLALLAQGVALTSLPGQIFFGYLYAPFLALAPCLAFLAILWLTDRGEGPSFRTRALLLCIPVFTVGVLLEWLLLGGSLDQGAFIALTSIPTWLLFGAIVRPPA